MYILGAYNFGKSSTSLLVIKDYDDEIATNFKTCSNIQSFIDERCDRVEFCVLCYQRRYNLDLPKMCKLQNVRYIKSSEVWFINLLKSFNTNLRFDTKVISDGIELDYGKYLYVNNTFACKFINHLAPNMRDFWSRNGHFVQFTYKTCVFAVLNGFQRQKKLELVEKLVINTHTLETYYDLSRVHEGYYTSCTYTWDSNRFCWVVLQSSEPVQVLGVKEC